MLGAAPLGKAFSRGLVLGGHVVRYRDQLQLTLQIPESSWAPGHALVIQVPQGLLDLHIQPRVPGELLWGRSHKRFLTLAPRPPHTGMSGA